MPSSLSRGQCAKFTKITQPRVVKYGQVASISPGVGVHIKPMTAEGAYIFSPVELILDKEFKIKEKFK